jgi:RNA polymerase nonessential primary-like sigma factor
MKNNKNGSFLDSNRKRLLTKDESYALIREFQETGSILARNKMVEHNYGLLLKISNKVMKEFNPKYINQDELVTEGVSGAVKAIAKFDLTLDFAFSTYAYFWIRESMQRYILSHDSLIRVPINAQEEDRLKVREHNDKIKNNSDMKQIVDEKSTAIRQAKFAMDSLDETFDDGDLKIDLMDNDSLSPENERYQEELKLRVKTLFLKLKPQAQKVMTYRFGLNGCEKLTLGETGDILGVTRERVRQIEVMTLKRLSKLVVNDANAYDRDETLLANMLESCKRKQFFEDVILNNYGCVKEYFHNCHSSKISYKSIAERFNVKIASVSTLAKKHGIILHEILTRFPEYKFR